MGRRAVEPGAVRGVGGKGLPDCDDAPMGPTLLVLDHELQNAPVKAGAALHVPKHSGVSYPEGELGAVREAARLMVNAEKPLIRAQKLARTPRGWDLLIEYAELVQAPVSVGTYGSWQDFPSWHPLSGEPEYALT